MWFYVVSWAIAVFVSDPCPGYQSIDEFGRDRNAGFSCLVMHGHTEYKRLDAKQFSDRDSAIAFYDHARKSSSRSIGFGETICNVKLDSLFKAAPSTLESTATTHNGQSPADNK